MDKILLRIYDQEVSDFYLLSPFLPSSTGTLLHHIVDIIVTFITRMLLWNLFYSKRNITSHLERLSERRKFQTNMVRLATSITTLKYRYVRLSYSVFNSWCSPWRLIPTSASSIFVVFNHPFLLILPLFVLVIYLFSILRNTVRSETMQHNSFYNLFLSYPLVSYTPPPTTFPDEGGMGVRMLVNTSDWNW